MPISKSGSLFALVKSLTRAEKRHFKIYAQRISDGEGLLFVQLFDILDKQKFLDESQIFTKIPKAKLPNLKRHLYSQILISLRLLERTKQAATQVRELIDFANILYNKGLYKQSLKILDKADILASKLADDMLRLQIIEFRKVIESRHITRTGAGQVIDLVDRAATLSDRIKINTALSNLRIELHGWYISKGHVRNEEEAEELRDYFHSILPEVHLDELNKIDKLYYFQAQVWYHFSLYDWQGVLRYSRLWVNLLVDSGVDIKRESNVLLRGYHYILTALYNLDNSSDYTAVLQEIEDYRHAHYKAFNMTTRVISFLYVHNGRLNKYILSRNYKEGIAAIPRTLSRIQRYRAVLDDHRILVFYFKIARLYHLGNQPEQAIVYLRKITHAEVSNLREDIQVYARLAFLMAHYDVGNHELMSYLIQEVKTGLANLSQESILQVKIPQFIDQMVNLPIGDRKEYARDFRTEMQVLSEDVYEQRAFKYLDVLWWLTSKC